MKLLPLFLLVSAGLVLMACEKPAPEQAATANPPSAPTTATPPPATVTPPSAAAPAPAVAPNAPIATNDGTTRYIDHSKDEIEFKLKKSLASLESMLETGSDPEQVAMMKKDMAKMQSQLDAL